MGILTSGLNEGCVEFLRTHFARISSMWKFCFPLEMNYKKWEVVSSCEMEDASNSCAMRKFYMTEHMYCKWRL